MKIGYLAIWILLGLGLISLAFAYLSGSGSVVSPNNNTLVSENVTINVTFTGTANITVEQNVSGTFETINFSDQVISPYAFLWRTENGSFSDGVYSLRINITNSTNSSDADSLLAINITVDNTNPSPVINNPTANQNLSQNPIEVNLTITDNFNYLLRYSIFVNDSLNQSGNTTNGTDTFVNISGLVDGIYTLIVQGTDNASNLANSSTTTFTKDTAAPRVSQTSPADGLSTNNATVTLNWTATDALDTSFACSLILNGTVNGSFTGSGSFSDVLNFTEGVHAWYVNCTDHAVNTNVTVNRSFTVDTTNPTVAASSHSLSSSSAVINVTADESVTATVFYSTTSGSLTTSQSGSTATSQNITLSGLAAGTTYYYRGQGCDAASNCVNTSELSFATSAATTSSSGGGGGGSRVPTVSSTSASFLLNKDFGTYVFQHQKKVHHIRIASLEGKTVVVRFTSDPVEVKLKEGEGKNVDITGDNVADVHIIAKKVGTNSVQFELSTPVEDTNEVVEETQPQVQSEEEVSGPEQGKSQQPIEQATQNEDENILQNNLKNEVVNSNAPVLGIIAVILVLLGAGYFLLRKKE